MPTYEYLCEDCGKTFETTQRITEPALDKCILCGGSSVKRLISPTAFHLKGGGWYKTDYASSSGKSSSSGSSSSESSGSSESSSASSDSKSSDSKSSEPQPSGTKSSETKSEPAKTETPKSSSSSGSSD